MYQSITLNSVLDTHVSHDMQLDTENSWFPHENILRKVKIEQQLNVFNKASLLKLDLVIFEEKCKILY